MYTKPFIKGSHYLNLVLPTALWVSSDCRPGARVEPLCAPWLSAEPLAIMEDKD